MADRNESHIPPGAPLPFPLQSRIRGFTSLPQQLSNTRAPEGYTVALRSFISNCCALRSRAYSAAGQRYSDLYPTQQKVPLRSIVHAEPGPTLGTGPAGVSQHAFPRAFQARATGRNSLQRAHLAARRRSAWGTGVSAYCNMAIRCQFEGALDTHAKPRYTYTHTWRRMQEAMRSESCRD